MQQTSILGLDFRAAKRYLAAAGVSQATEFCG